MNTAVLIPLFNSLLGIMVTVILGLAAAAAQKYIKNADARAAIQGALTNASGIALAYGQARGDQFLQNGTIKNAALAAAAAYVADQAPAAMAHFGQSPADIATKVEGAVAKALSLATPIPETVPPTAAPVVVAEVKSGGAPAPTPQPEPVLVSATGSALSLAPAGT
jgi:hypothetical protein